MVQGLFHIFRQLTYRSTSLHLQRKTVTQILKQCGSVNSFCNAN